MEHDPLPFQSHDLITLLDQLYPHECIKPGETLEDAHRRAGARELIDQLISLRDEDMEAARERVAGEADQDPRGG